MLVMSKAILFAFILYFVTIEARNREHTNDDTLTSKLHEETNDSERVTHEGKHRRKRNWHYNNYYPSRRYPDPYQDDFFGAFDQHQTQMEILRKLDEILVYVRRPPPPPPPPQYIYVRYPVPSQCNCNKKPTNVPSGGVPGRFPSMEDSNQNWGAVDNEYPDEEFNRPLDFNGVTASPIRPTTSNIDPVTQAPRESETQANCYAAVLQCCNFSDKRQQLKCITDRGCPKTTKSVCNKQSVDAAIDYFSKTYAPR